jgi:enamine deaminase RidA (YjgF/YER057c/UK114 family)
LEIQRSPFVIAGQNREWAKATVVSGNRGTIYLSGSAGTDPATGKTPESIGEQTKNALQSIKTILEEYGSSLKYILHMFYYVKGSFPDGMLGNPVWQEADEAMQDFWRENCPEFAVENNPPASTLVGVAALAVPELKIEIQAVAAIP